MLSVVVPCFNEEPAIVPFVARLRPVLEGLASPYEVIFVDDGSTDATSRALALTATEWSAAVVVTHTENLGQQTAIGTGLARTRGDHIVTMDADLQDPPELISELVAAGSHVDIVYARRTDRSADSRFTRVTATIFYWAIARVLAAPVVREAADFRLMSRRAVDALEDLPAELRVYRVVLPWLRLPSATVDYARAPRVAGHGHYTLPRMLRLAWAGLRTAARLRRTRPTDRR